MAHPIAALLALASLTPCSTQASGGCAPSWVPTFGGLPGTDAIVHALAVFDDGNGPAVYVGGEFASALGITARGIVKWDGAAWSEPGGGVNGDVYCMAVFDDGGGPALYVGGEFEAAGGAPANHIAKWDGSSWSALGSGVGGAPSTTGVYALTVFDEGPGADPALYVGGRFMNAGAVPMTRFIARWDGASWSSLGLGMDGQVQALAVFDDGNGRKLYAGGKFALAGGSTVSFIARWNGADWSRLGTGLNDFVHSLAIFDDDSGGGDSLYAGGEFASAGGIAANRVAKWDGTTWSPLASGLTGGIDSVAKVLRVFDDGAGPVLLAGGEFDAAGGVSATGIAQWDGTQWSPFGNGIAGYVYALHALDPGLGGSATLIAGGWFGTAGGVEARFLASWNGTTWAAFSEGLTSTVNSLASFDDGSGGGPALYASGHFEAVGDLALNHIGKWDGAGWSALGSGLSGPARALMSFDDGLGGGPALYAAGAFLTAGGLTVNRIARWDGSSWSALGSGLGETVEALCAFDDGGGAGAALCAGGEFGVAKWDGATWTALGALGGAVYALTAFDDALGAGPTLYAGGILYSTGSSTSFYVARWDGAAWAPFGGGVNGRVRALMVFDDGLGSGPALYATGEFMTAGSVMARRIARWDGTSWSALLDGINGPAGSEGHALAVHDDGSGAGAALYVGGNFTGAGGVQSANIAKWDGAHWSGLAPGMSSYVLALTGIEDPSGAGRGLYAGGFFRVSPAADSYLAKWSCDSAGPGVAYCFGDGSGTACPCGNAGAADEGCANSSGMGAVLAASGSSSVAADDLVLHAEQLLLNQSALLFAAQNLANGGDGNPFGDGLRCASGGVRRFSIEVPDGAGTADWGPGLGATGGWASGDTRRFQVWYRDPTGSPCGHGFNLSNGLEVAFEP